MIEQEGFVNHDAYVDGQKRARTLFAEMDKKVRRAGYIYAVISLVVCFAWEVGLLEKVIVLSVGWLMGNLVYMSEWRSGELYTHQDMNAGVVDELSRLFENRLNCLSLVVGALIFGTVCGVVAGSQNCPATKYTSCSELIDERHLRPDLREEIRLARQKLIEGGQVEVTDNE